MLTVVTLRAELGYRLRNVGERSHKEPLEGMALWIYLSSLSLLFKMIFTKAFSWELRKTAFRGSDLGLYSLAKESDLTPSMFLTDTVIVSCDSFLRDKGAVSAPCLNFSSILCGHVTRQSPTQLLMLCGLSSMSYGVTGPLQCSFGLSWLQKISNFFFSHWLLKTFLETINLGWLELARVREDVGHRQYSV